MSMKEKRENSSGKRGLGWRLAVWRTAVFLLLLPLVAMQFTEEVQWTLLDFVVFGAMLAGACGAYELAARASGNGVYRTAAGVAVMAAFILVWLSLGVGIIGRDGDPANLMVFGVLAVGIVGAVIARLQAHGMAVVMFAMALSQALVAAIALIAGLGRPWSGPAEIMLLNGFFIVLFTGSALLFRKAAQEQTHPNPTR